MKDDLVASVAGLSVAFGAGEAALAVREVSFEVTRGKTLAIVGESGSGKSVTSLSLMRLVELGGGRITAGRMQLRTRHDGVVDLMQATPAQLRRLRGADVAMIFQEPMTSLNPVFKVGVQLIEAIRLHQQGDRRSHQARALRMLVLVRIPDGRAVLERYPHQLSGGMRQRIMIAMALACEPTLLIADEPTTALDVTVQSQILQIIKGLQQEMGMGVVFITHDMGVVAEIADEVMVMRAGQTVECAPVQRLFSQPRHAYTRRLLAAVPRLGDMRGSDLPARFNLPGADEPASGGGTDAAAPTTVHVPAYHQAPLLRVQHLVARYDLRSGLLGRVKRRVHAVEDVSFDLYAGETLALVGESGCGKSTTARVVARLIKAQGGDVTFDGTRMADLHGHELKRFRSQVQMIFQDPYALLDPRRTVGQALMEPLLVHGIVRGDAARARVTELLEKVGLKPEHAGRYPHEFSGGQRQRICIARSLALSPRLIVADESVSALDVSIQAQVINLMQDLQRELGIAFLFISHDMAVVERISHRVAVMYLGRIVEIGSRRQIFENPRHPYTRKLMAAVPVADPSRRGLRGMLDGDIPSPIHGVDYVPPQQQLEEVAPGHFVAHEALLSA